MKNNRKILILIVGVLLIFVTAAIFVVGNRGSAGNEETSELVTEISTVESLDTGSSDASEVSASEETPETAESTQEVAAVIPTPRTGLESTDPASVNLTSGSIQVVEVFAFW